MYLNYGKLRIRHAQGLIKPETEIFNAICSRYQLEPSDCIFFDDLKENIEAAQQFGMKGEHVNDSSLGYQALYRIAADNGLPLETI